MMRAFILTLLLLGISSCQQEGSGNNPGWRFGSSGRGPHFSYHFGDADKVKGTMPGARETVFAGTCDSSPVFLVTGGDYALNTTQFRLLVDDMAWNLDAFHGEHGRALYVDQPEAVAALRNAQRRVAFEVGSWRRELKPSPLIRKFVDECRAQRKASS